MGVLLKRFGVGASAVLIGLSYSGDGVFAQKATPSHAFQAVDTLNAELALLLDADESQMATDANAPALTKRRPRHVFQNARLVFRKIQALRSLNGLDPRPLVNLPGNEVTPADVQALAVALIGDTRSLRPVFGVERPEAEIPFVDGKTPLDVYQHITNASMKLDGLGIPGIVPNDVYQVALEIHTSLGVIVKSRGGNVTPISHTSKGKKPGEVYDLTFTLLEALKSKIEREKIEIPGGIVLPNRRQGRITPSHVLSLMNNAYGEIHSMGIALGIKYQPKKIPAPSGKTPSNVFDAVQASLQLVDQLNQGG